MRIAGEKLAVVYSNDIEERSYMQCVGDALEQWFPTFFDAFLPLLILELSIPPLWNFHFSRVCVRRLLLTTIGTMVFIDDNHLIIKTGTKTMLSNNGTKVCQYKCVIVY